MAGILIPKDDASVIWPDMELHMSHLEVSVEYVQDMIVKMTPTGERDRESLRGIYTLDGGTYGPPVYMQLTEVEFTPQESEGG